MLSPLIGYTRYLGILTDAASLDGHMVSLT